MKNNRDKTGKIPAVFEQMEPRLLFSAGTEAALAASALPGPGVPESALVQELVSETGPAGEIQAPAEVRQELVFVDLSAPDYQQLADDLLANNNGNRQIKVFYLDGKQDGIEQISAVLEQQQGIDAIHIISHGNEEGLKLGNSWLTNTSLNEYRQSIQGWRNALNNDADVLLYGCNLAGGEEGAALVDKLATLTGAARVALGAELPALFANNDKLAADILAAGERTADPVWRLPLHEGYRGQLKSRIADLNNISPGGFGGAITAALFLEAFIESFIAFWSFGHDARRDEDAHPRVARIAPVLARLRDVGGVGPDEDADQRGGASA